ncbi:MAG TPA: cytochrome c [Rhodocyclaceae bacterium]|nr:cytochrome c [Rhodocyclaceae bacterium]
MNARLRCGIAAWLAVASLFFTGSATAADTPQKNYRLFCMGCHGADGSGSPQNGIPSMKGEVGYFLRLPAGRAYLSQVPGTLNTPLNNQQTAELLNWVMANIAKDSVPADFKPYTGDEVAAYRASVPLDIPALRVQLLEQLEKQ